MEKNISVSSECKSGWLNILNSNEQELEKYMKEKSGCSAQSQQQKIRVIFQFPAKSSKDDLIKSEVKAIMTSALQEQMHSLTS